MDPRDDLLAPGGFLADVLSGLDRAPKSVSSKYLYDERGSQLFEAICDQPEYYPTRTETALLARLAPQLAALIPDGATLVEFGSGASVKTRLLLDAAPQIGGYTPIDISAEALDAAAALIRADYPALKVTPVLGDFTGPIPLPTEATRRVLVGFFPGSTIGNFPPAEAERFLAGVRIMLGAGAMFVVGFDLVKDSATLLAAYDDAAGITAAFDKNLLARMNAELGADFDLNLFEHRAVWNAAESRMEMHLVSRSACTVRVGDRSFRFAPGETLHTENSYKFTVEGFAGLATRAGWTTASTWASPPPAFALTVLRNA